MARVEAAAAARAVLESLPEVVTTSSVVESVLLQSFGDDGN